MVVGIGLVKFVAKIVSETKRYRVVEPNGLPSDPEDILTKFIKHINPYIFIAKDKNSGLNVYEYEVDRDKRFSSEKYEASRRYRVGLRETDCWFDYVAALEKCTAYDIKEICKELINEGRYSKS